MTFRYWREPALAAALLLATLVLSVLAGAYPAFVMSAMRPANALHRGNAAPGRRAFASCWWYCSSAVLIALLFCTAVIHRQTTFAMGEGLRIDRDQVLMLRFRRAAVR